MLKRRLCAEEGGEFGGVLPLRLRPSLSTVFSTAFERRFTRLGLGDNDDADSVEVSCWTWDSVSCASESGPGCEPCGCIPRYIGLVVLDGGGAEPRGFIVN